MVYAARRKTLLVLLFCAGLASALMPTLPPSALAADAVRDALVVPPSRPVAAPAPAAQARAQGVQAAAQADRAREVQAQAPARGRSVIARATAYNSLAAQTDSTPFITATGTRTRPGVVALSRDLLRVFPYGSRVMIQDLSGRNAALLNGRVFVVEDTMAARKVGSIDIWMASRSDALRFGARQVRITAVR